MFKIFALFVALLGLSFSSGPAATVTPTPTTAIERQHANTHRIAVYDMLGAKGFNKEAGHCSGTVVGPHAILTAQHCFQDSNLIRLDTEKEPTVIVAAIIDGNDHVIYIVNREFSTWTPISERQLVSNEPVHFWGAPGHNKDVYRDGYFQKMTTEKDVDPDEKFQFQMFILPVFGGDSGSGILDADGSVVAVVSMSDESAENLDLPLAFTVEQLGAITK
jgi:V8-like Glu-specific endopeptidase